MEDIVRDSTGSRRFRMLLLSGFALFALVLAAIGIAGAVSFFVTQRSREIGLRVALGARTIDVLRSVVGRTMTWALVGVGIGIAGSMGLTRLLSGLLYDVKPNDPWVLGVVAIAAGGNCLACRLPPGPAGIQDRSDGGAEVRIARFALVK